MENWTPQFFCRGEIPYFTSFFAAIGMLLSFLTPFRSKLHSWKRINGTHIFNKIGGKVNLTIFISIVRGCHKFCHFLFNGPCRQATLKKGGIKTGNLPWRPAAPRPSHHWKLSPQPWPLTRNWRPAHAEYARPWLDPWPWLSASPCAVRRSRKKKVTDRSCSTEAREQT